MKYFILIVLFLIGAVAFPQGKSAKTTKAGFETLTKAQNQFLDTLQYRSFLYFINEVDKATGLVKDRSAEWSPASTAATGFGVLCWAIGVEKKWITREEATLLTLHLFEFLDKSAQSAAPDVTGYKGFYYHFLKLKDGTREWKCELSSIDSAFLYASMIFARRYFTHNNESEKQIRALVEKLLAKVDWEYFRFDGKAKNPYAIKLGWDPESGFTQEGWTGYCEALILYVIAAGMDMNHAYEGYQTWLRSYDWRKVYGYEFLSFPPMFGHQYSHMFIDFRGKYDDFNRNKNLDYFETSRLATLIQRQYAVENPSHWKGYDSLCWGVTACDGPGDKYNSGNKKFEGYAGRGTSGDLVFFDDGTLAPTAAAGSIPFLPKACVSTLMNMKEKYGDKGIWGKYGFVDAFNPTVDWYDKDYIGIDQGPIVIMIENFRNGFVWKYMKDDPIITKGLAKLGFKDTK